MFVLLVLIPISMFAQYEYGTEVNQIDSLIKEFPEEEAVILKSTVNYSFKRDNSLVPLKVVEKSTSTYIALEDNAKVVARKYYDAYSKLNNHRFSSPNSYSVEHFQRCGNYEADGIFYHDAKVCNFFMGMKKTGDQIVLTTTKTFLDPKYFTRVFLNDDYTVKERIIRFHVPSYVEMEIIEENFDGFNIQRKEYDEKGDKGRVIEYRAIDLPATIGMDNLPGASCAFPHLVIIVKGFRIGNDTVNVIRDNDDLYRWYKSLINDPILSSDVINLAQELSGNQISDSAKVASIYYWVQSNIRYIAFEDGIAALKPESPNSVFLRKYGDCKGMANLTKALLKNAGFDARLCWIGTDHVCYTRDIPSALVDNHMICAVKMNGQFVFLDPTVKNIAFGEIHEGIQGKSAIVEDGENYLIIQVPEILPEYNSIQVNNEISLNGDKMLIDGSILLGGMQKYSFQYFLENLQSPDKKKMVRYFITQADNNYSLSRFEHTPVNSLAEKFVISYTMGLDNNVIDLGDELLIRLDLYTEQTNSTIDSTRSYPYSFGFRRQNKQRTILKIPEGFVAKMIPEPIMIDVGNFKIVANYELTDSTITYCKEILIREKILEKEDFREWNRAIQKLNAFYDNMLILSKL